MHNGKVVRSVEIRERTILAGCAPEGTPG
jgi:hypothetical protein